MKWGKGILAGAILGAAFSLIFVTYLKVLQPPPWVGHAVAVGIVVIGAISIAVQAQRGILRRKHGTALAIIAGTMIVLSVAIVMSISAVPLVAERARLAANGAPYCVQVVDNVGGTYRPEQALLDLSGLSLWSNGVVHHAMLVVGDSLKWKYLHWSWRANDFIERDTIKTSTTCIPRISFLEGLPFLFPKPSARKYVRLENDHSFLIPNVFKPTWSVNFLSVRVEAPEFGMDREMLSDAAIDHEGVSVSWDAPWLVSLIKGYPVRSAGQMQKLALDEVAKVYPRSTETRHYVASENSQAAGAPTTFISCYAGSSNFPASCQHHFLKEGRHYSFRHKPYDLRDWQKLQERVLALFASFEHEAREAELAR